jgi:hypothetical protein
VIKVNVTEYSRGIEPRQYVSEVTEDSALGVMFDAGAETVTVTTARSITSYSRVTPG